MSQGSSWVPQETLKAWNLTELEFVLVLAAIIFGVLCPFTICVLCFCLRAPPAEKYREPPSEPVPPAPAPASPKDPKPEPIAIDMESDKLIAINGRPILEGRKGVSLPYTPDLSIVVTPNRPHIGAARGSGTSAADDATDAGIGQAHGQYGYAEYDGALGPGMGGQAGVYRGNGYEAEESSWEAERIEGLEHRVRVLEAAVIAVRGNALPPLDRRLVGGELPTTSSRPPAPASVVATPAHVGEAAGDRYRIAEQAADRGAVNARLTFDVA